MHQELQLNFLDDLPLNKRQVLVRLPYRVGLWISQSDTAGGDASDEQEMQALSNIINGFAEDVFGAEAIQFIISETVNNSDLWPQWGENLDDVLQECRESSGLLALHVGEKEARAFQMQIFDIGEAIAMAFTEHEHMDGFIPCAKVRLAYIQARIKGSSRSYSEFISISAAERKALAQLSDALGGVGA